MQLVFSVLVLLPYLVLLLLSPYFHSYRYCNACCHYYCLCFALLLKERGSKYGHQRGLGRDDVDIICVRGVPSKVVGEYFMVPFNSVIIVLDSH